MTEATTPPAADGDSPFSAPPRLGSELRALRRSRSDRVVAGVLGGMGRRLGVDPLLLRIVTVVLAIFGGVGVLAYAAAWLLIPAEDDEGSVAEQALGRQDTGSPRTATVALALGLTLVVLVAGGGIVGGDWDGGVLLLLAALGFVVLLRRDDRRPAAEPARGDHPGHPPTSGIDYPGYPGYPGYARSSSSVTVPQDADPTGAATEPATEDDKSAADDEAAATGAAREGTANEPATQPAATADPSSAVPTRWWAEDPDWENGQRLDDETWDSYPAPVTAPATPTERPRSALGRITVSVAALAIGIVAVNDATWATVPAATYVATALAIVGLGLLVGSWWGRSRGLIALGIVLGLALVPAVIIGRFDLGSENFTFRPTTLAELPTGTEHRGAGSVLYDLSAVPFTDADRETLDIDQTAGDLTVIVPPAVDVVVEADIGAGEIQAFGNASSGLGQERRFTDDGGSPGGGTLTLGLDLGAGSIEVRREAP
jgi:phage shock protein PspC (stress-responsive transcriptional regulator)